MNSGSSTTGLNSVQPTATTITTTVPGAHQKRGSRRISHSSATASSPISTALIETDNTQSHAHPSHERVFSPTSIARIRLTIVNGSTTALCATAIAAPASAPCHHRAPARRSRSGGRRTR